MIGIAGVSYVWNKPTQARADGEPGSLMRFLHDNPPHGGDDYAILCRAAVRRLSEFLGRSATPDDLQPQVLAAFSAARLQEGIAQATVRKECEVLAAIKRFDARQQWTIDELNRILGSARTMPAHVAGIPAGDWWLGLVLVLLDTHCPLVDLLLAYSDALDDQTGRLAVGSLVYELHPLAFEAARRVKYLGQAEHQRRLFPWPLDGHRLVPRDDRPTVLRHQPLYMLLRQYKAILWRANLPYASNCLFNRLQRCAVSLDELDPSAAFVPRPGKPTFPRTVDRQRAQHRAAKAIKKRGRRGPRKDAGPPPGSISEFIETKFIPVRMADKAKISITHARMTVRRFTEHLGRAAMLTDFTDDDVEAYLVARFNLPRSPYTVNRERAELLSIWRYAWSKKAVETVPRSVKRFKLPKRLPVAWSLDELARILSQCAAQQGTLRAAFKPSKWRAEPCDDLPANLWWTSLVLVVYETGLRIGAVAKLRLSDLDPETRVLSVPAEFQKHNSDQRFILHPDTIALLRRMHTQRGLLFPMAANHQWRRHTYRAILTAAGLPATKRDLFHKLRRTSGTFLEDVAGEAAAVKHLGHSDPKLYAQFYRDATKLRIANASDLLPRPAY